MKLYVAKYYDTDEYTYGCDIVLGVFSTKEKADQCALHWAENVSGRPDSFEIIEVCEHELDVPWEG